MRIWVGTALVKAASAIPVTATLWAGHRIIAAARSCTYEVVEYTSSAAIAASECCVGCKKTPFGPPGRSFRCNSILSLRLPRKPLRRLHGGAPERAVALHEEASRTCQPSQASTSDRTRRIRVASAASTDLLEAGGRWHRPLRLIRCEGLMALCTRVRVCGMADLCCRRHTGGVRYIGGADAAAPGSPSGLGRTGRASPRLGSEEVFSLLYVIHCIGSSSAPGGPPREVPLVWARPPV